MTTRTCTRYHRTIKHNTKKQSRLSNSSTQRSDYDEEVCRNSRSAGPLIGAVLAVCLVFWGSVIVWVIRELFA